MSLERRQLTSRGAGWAKSLARKLAQGGVSPNAISIASVGFSILAFAAFSYAGMRREDSTALSRALFAEDQSWRWCLILGAAFIQLRLVCNLMDGMIAVEHEKKTIFGELYNDVPDRIADVFIIMGCALVAKGPYRLDLGWFCSVTAVATAYVRTLGGAIGAKQRYLGPMAKQHRMAALTAGCVLLALFPDVVRGHNVMDAVLFVVSIGAAYTCWRRLRAIAQDLREADGVRK